MTLTINPMPLTDAPLATAPLAAGLFGGSRAQRDEPLVEPLAGDQAASRRQSFSDLFRVDGAMLRAA